MALVDTTWYLNAGDQATTGHYAVAKRAQNAAVVAGQLVRQFTAPTVGNERVFVCIVAGTTANVTDATWVLTRGAKTVDGTATWMEVTGQASLNGDLVNTATWAQVKAATPAVLGQIIKRSNNASYQICTTAGAMSASEPAFSDTAGTTTTDTTAVWTSLGPIGNFTGGQAPHARLASAGAGGWFVAGNTIYVGDNSSELQTSGFFNILPASTSALSKLICHNHSGSYPPTSSDLMNTALMVSSVGGGAYGINGGGWWYIHGVIFRAASGYSSGNSSLTIGTNSSWYYFNDCSLQNADTGTSPSISVGAASGCVVTFNNTTVRFSSSTARLILGSGAKFIWQNTGQVLASGSSIPGTLIQASSASGVINAVLEALDLSQITTVLVTANGNNWIADALVKDCKLNAAVNVSGTPPIGPGFTLQLVRSSA